MNKMNMLKKVITSLVTGTLAVCGFAGNFDNIMTGSYSYITASAATVFAPSLNGNYIAGFCNSDGNIPVYADSSLRTRGASPSKWGKAPLESHF